jgi:PAS domain S-box-containing protein
MVPLVRGFDWSKTPLGPISRWPNSLSSAVNLCLSASLPMFVWWGPDLINIYNDAYCDVLGKRHPDALGQPAKKIWADIWDVIGSDVDAVVKRGIPIVKRRVRFVMERNGYPEETFFTYSHSPIPNDDGSIGGLFQVCVDETASVNAERERERLAAQRKLALDAARMGWWHHETSNRVLQFDQRFAEIFGISGGQKPVAEILKRVHPDDLPELRATIQQAVSSAEPKPFSVRFRILREDGTFRWLEGHGTFSLKTVDGEQKPESYVGTVVDITQRVLADAQAQTILESITDAFFAVDRDWQFRYVNPQAERMLERTPGDLLGKVIWDVYPGLIGSAFEKAYLTASRDRVAQSVTSYYPDHQRWYEVHVYPAPDKGISIYFRDVTERVRAEESLRESASLLQGISDSTGDVIYAKDRQGRMRFANPAALRLIGKELAHVIGQTDADFLADKNAAEMIMQNDRRVMETGVAADVEEPIPLPDGMRRIWLSRKMPHYNNAGEVVGLLGVSRDITEDKTRDDELREMAGKFERQSRLFERIASSTPDFIYVFDLQGRFLYANRRLLEVWGTTLEQAVGKNLYELNYPQWHADMHMREIRQVITTKQPIRGEVPFTGGSGISGVYEYIFTPVLDLDGNVEVIAGTTRDVTERRTNELRTARDATLLANVQDSVIVTTLQGIVTFWNQGATQLFGWTEAEMLGRHYADRFPEPARTQVADWLQRIATNTASDSERAGEWLDIRKDGSRVWIEGTTRHITGEDSQSLGIMGVCRNITSRKDADAERETLLASERAARAEVVTAQARLISAFHGSPAFMAVMRGPEHIYEFVNEALYALVGHRQLLGKPVAVALPEAKDQGYVDLLNRVYETGEPFIGKDLPAAFEREKGGPLERRYVDFAYQPLREADGSITGIFLHGVDTTDRLKNEQQLRESESRFRQLADAMPQIVWTARSDGTLDYYNRRWFEFIGLNQDSKAELVSWEGYVHPEDLARAVEVWMQSVQSGKPYRTEFRVRGATQEYLWFLVRADPATDASGNVVRWYGSCTDITDRKRAEEERQVLLETERAARGEAERASRMKDEFLATLSHELRTPLNAILGWSTILANGTPTPEDLRDGLDTIQRNARAQTQIIEDLLDMSRIISGKVRLEVQRTDLAPILQAAVDTVKPAAEAKGVRLRSVLDPHAGPVSGDPNRLQQVFWNLLTNAVKFTPKGGQVQVLLERVNSHLEITVVDTGEGIRAEFLPHVFDRFRQADASTTRRHGGLGLGLAIVKQLVELHGGTVRVKSPGPGKGATFTVAMPLTVIHPELEADPRERRHPDAVGASNQTDDCVKLTGVKVLVVDDEPDARALVKRLLSDCEAEVRVAGSANEAIAAFKAQTPDVLISDIGMPGEDGYSLIRRVRALSSKAGGNVPAIALTAYARTDDRIRAIRSGFQTHVVKPVDPMELITVVASLAGRNG